MPSVYFPRWVAFRNPNICPSPLQGNVWKRAFQTSVWKQSHLQGGCRSIEHRRGSRPPGSPRVSPAQWGVAVFIGESSQTHSFRCTHKNKAYLNVLFRSRLSWLTRTLFPWEACLGEGWLYCHVQETCDTWDVHLSHCWHSAASEDQEGGVCTGTPQKWEPVLERWQSRVCSKALGATFQITIWDRRPLYAELQTRGHQKWKLQHPKLHQACLALVSCNHSELSIPSIFKLCWH